MNLVIFLTLIFVLAAEIIILELKGVRNKNHLKVIRKEVRNNFSSIFRGGNEGLKKCMGNNTHYTNDTENAKKNSKNI